jgi:hypothetical protein
VNCRCSTTAPGPLTNTAAVVAAETDPVPGNNRDAVTVCVEREVSCCDPCGPPRRPGRPCPPPPVAPDPCNALTATPAGLLVPRVRVAGTFGPPPGLIADDRPSVDVRVDAPAPDDCPQTYTVRAYLSPRRGEAGPVGDVDLLPTRTSDTWADTPLQVTLPEPGVYLVTGDIDTQICATVDTAGSTNLWTTVRLVAVPSGTVELGPRQSAQHQFSASPTTRFQHCTSGPTPLTGLVTVTPPQGTKTVRVQAILRGGGTGNGLTGGSTIQTCAFRGSRSYLTYVKVGD